MLDFESDDNSLLIAPVLGANMSIDKNGIQSFQRSDGFLLSGHLGENLTLYAKAVDNLVSGKSQDRTRELESTRGIVISNDRGSNGFDYDEAEMQIGYRWRYLQLFLEKVHDIWGYGTDGSVILSDKAPSFPEIRLVISLGNRLRFTYIHGSLYSGIMDSTSSYVDPHTRIFRSVSRTKYLASHLLEYSPSEALNLALGESMVYSDHLKLEYLFPLMFFRSADHQANSPDNAQIFLGGRYTLARVGSFYGTLFIDDLNIDKFFSSENTNIIAGTLGAKFIDVLAPNLDLNVEYTRLNPWVYTHEYDATDYTSNGYPLGHWLGQNADLIFVSMNYRWTNEICSRLFFQKIRKGPLGSEALHYSSPWDQKFLEGDVYSQEIISFESKWELIRNLFAVCTISSTTGRGITPLEVPQGKILSADLSLNLNLFE